MGLGVEYLAALALLGRVFEAYAAATGFNAVLVGGAATAICTDGLFPSGDFDVVASDDAAFAAAMADFGFVQEDRAGKLRVGWYHPDHPPFGFQQVSGPLFDGRAEQGRLIRVTVTSTSTVILPAVEDLIADRLAQHAIASPTNDSRLRQARALLDMADQVDWTYLRKRVLEEGGDPDMLEGPR